LCRRLYGSAPQSETTLSHEIDFLRGSEDGKRSDSPVEIVAKLQEATALVADGYSVAEAARPIGVTEKTYREWQTECGGLARLLGPTLPRKNRRTKRSPRM
jgi:hypothetical protein